MDKGTGVRGEKYAVEFLRNHGYRILERNFRTRFGEIDIIAADKKYIVFVEVKTRGDRRIAEPVEWVTREKQKKILSAAAYYLQGYTGNLQPRFDVAGITLDSREKLIEVNYVEDAFGGGGGIAFF